MMNVIHVIHVVRLIENETWKCTSCVPLGLGGSGLVGKTLASERNDRKDAG